jgi:Amt family ammonium transporter
MLGTLILWFGWYGFNSGSTMILDTEHYDTLAALAAINTTLSAGAGGISAMTINMVLLNLITGETTYDLTYTMNGALAGLVAITAGCGVVEPWAAIIIGCVAGFLYLFSSWTLIWYRLDDAVDAVPVHFVNGIWGLISTGCFASPLRLEQGFGITEHAGLFYGKGASLFGAQCIAVFFIIGWILVTMVPFFFTLEAYDMFRTNVMSEVYGLDAEFAGGFVSDSQGMQLSPEEVKYIQERMRERIETAAIADADTDAVLDDVTLQMEVSFRYPT